MAQASTFAFLTELSERLHRGDPLDEALVHANNLASQSTMAIEQAQLVLSRLRSFNRGNLASLPDDGA